jgi:nicotinamidase-related amidase
MSKNRLPIPPHFAARSVGRVWRVPYQQRAVEAEEWAAEHQVLSASADRRRIALLLVDCQNTFCLPEFELFVAGRSGGGAMQDNVRVCEFIYRNLPVITQIIATLDTHTALQIFHPIFWVDQKGHHPAGGQTIISTEDVLRGKWKVNPDIANGTGVGSQEKLDRYAEYYVAKLTESGKYPLMIWPYHAMLGGIGHALVSAVEEAVFFHSVARNSATRFHIKGNNPLTEHYSVLHPEVREDQNGEPLASQSCDFTQTLLDFDAIIIAGQAKSHCVAWTVDDLLAEAKSRDPALVNKIHLLEDCTSSVVVPGVVDFTEPADKSFRRFAAAGAHVVKSTDPIEQWLELPQ